MFPKSALRSWSDARDGSQAAGHACPSGYPGDGVTGCVDIDECETDNGGCDELTSCTNISGGRTCGACPSGYTGDGATGCTDIDECETDNGGCGAAQDWYQQCWRATGLHDAAARPQGLRHRCDLRGYFGGVTAAPRASFVT